MYIYMCMYLHVCPELIYNCNKALTKCQRGNNVKRAGPTISYPCDMACNYWSKRV